MSDDLEHQEGNSLARIMHALTVGTTQAVRARDRTKTRNKPSEMEQQFQFAIKGKAAPEVAFAEVPVKFTHAYYFAPAERDSGLQFPQFTFGSHITSTPPVAVTATVKEWINDPDNGAIIGAVVAVGVLGSGPFTGYVHLTFQGYGALIEPDEEDLVNGGLPEGE